MTAKMTANVADDWGFWRSECMNEMAYASWVDLAIRGDLMHCDVTELNRRLRRDIHSPRGYFLGYRRTRAASSASRKGAKS